MNIRKIRARKTVTTAAMQQCNAAITEAIREFQENTGLDVETVQLDSDYDEESDTCYTCGARITAGLPEMPKEKEEAE